MIVNKKPITEPINQEAIKRSSPPTLYPEGACGSKENVLDMPGLQRAIKRSSPPILSPAGACGSGKRSKQSKPKPDKKTMTANLANILLQKAKNRNPNNVLPHTYLEHIVIDSRSIPRMVDWLRTVQGPFLRRFQARLPLMKKEQVKYIAMAINGVESQLAMHNRQWMTNFVTDLEPYIDAFILSEVVRLFVDNDLSGNVMAAIDNCKRLRNSHFYRKLVKKDSVNCPSTYEPPEKATTTQKKNIQRKTQNEKKWAIQFAPEKPQQQDEHPNPMPSGAMAYILDHHVTPNKTSEVLQRVQRAFILRLEAGREPFDDKGIAVFSMLLARIEKAADFETLWQQQIKEKIAYFMVEHVLRA